VLKTQLLNKDRSRFLSGVVADWLTKTQQMNPNKMILQIIATIFKYCFLRAAHHSSSVPLLLFFLYENQTNHFSLCYSG